MPHKWNLINTGLSDGAYNMALDQALVLSVQAGRSLPLIRFFGWNPPAVSLGYNQKIGDLDVSACRNAGFDIVRRPTGGRAVIHRDEFTYSVVAPENDPTIGGSILETYHRIAEGLLEGLRVLGVGAEIVKSSASDNASKGSALCFAAAGRYEISSGGKKLIGSAQRRIEGVILQQGSLLLSCGQNEKFFAEKHQEIQAGTLGELLGRVPDFEEVADGMKLGFARAWGIELEDRSATLDEKNTARDLKKTSDIF